VAAVLAPPAGEASASTEAEEMDPVSTWVSLTLFVLLLVGGMALTGYIFLWPLFSPD
jgi:hypothetical protein